MKKIILIPLLFLFTIQFNAQDLELIVGRNFTTYDYTNSEGASNPNLDGASGSYIEVSYNVPFNRNQDFYYSLGLALNNLIYWLTIAITVYTIIWRKRFKILFYKFVKSCKQVW